jgi:CheY-like chemotaxis protein/nitrogen-specific signal transduction histidine kinase
MHPTTETEPAVQRPQPADGLQSEFISVVSHELRTPVSAIQGYTDLLLESAYGDLNPEQREIVVYMREAAGSLMGMIENLLSLSVMNRGQTDLVLRTCPVEEVIRDVLMTCRTEYERKKLSVVYRIDPPDLCIRSDKVKLQQILTNLLVNAIRYTDKGSIRVGARKVAGPGDAAPLFVLEVADSGRGISREDQERIFERFFRGNESAQQEAQGMGLGLYIVRSLVRILSGSIQVKSEPGHGSVFTVTLPAEFEEVEALQNLLEFNHTSRGTADGSSWLAAAQERTVLFLGGDDERCRLLSANLPHDGIRVLSVQTMPELIQQVEALRPVAIVIEPPSGAQFEELKLHAATRRIPILFFMESTGGAALAVNGDGSASKPALKLPPRSAGTNGHGKYRVLVTDDDSGMREALHIALDSEGYEVLLASDGREALQLLEQEHPDLMLLDLMMPGLNGWQVIDILGQKPELRETKVLMLTGAILSPEEAQNLNARTGGLLRKDELKLNNILDGVARALGQN